MGAPAGVEQSGGQAVPDTNSKTNRSSLPSNPLSAEPWQRPGSDWLVDVGIPQVLVECISVSLHPGLLHSWEEMAGDIASIFTIQRNLSFYLVWREAHQVCGLLYLPVF